MTKSKRAKEERERFKDEPTANLLELRKTLHKEVQVLMDEKNRKVGSIDRVNKELKSRQHESVEEIAVTDHAVVRYLERVKGLDLEGARQEIIEMANRAVRRDSEFLEDPVTGMVIVRRKGSASIATILERNAEKTANAS